MRKNTLVYMLSPDGEPKRVEIEAKLMIDDPLRLKINGPENEFYSNLSDTKQANKTRDYHIFRIYT